MPLPHSFLNQEAVTDPEEMTLSRKFLGLTQAQLAAKLSTTSTSVSRWESETTPISAMTMAHLRQLMTQRLQEEISRLFRELRPKLTISRYTALVGHPEARITRDRDGNRYLGSVFIDPGYRKHVLCFRLNDQAWYGLDKDEKATKVDDAFLRELIDS
jgi:transcriptional regulator with XRE-family HTH domain